MLKLNCIKCAQKYDTEDPDPYLCEKCNLERLEVAKEIDSKMSSVRRVVKSDNKILEETGVLNPGPGVQIRMGTPKAFIK